MEMYAEHETLYIKDALLCENIIEGKNEYAENEVSLTWQIANNGSWQDCTDATAAMVEITARDCRQIYRVNKLSSTLANNTFQERVRPWIYKCFPDIADNIPERIFRFIEEATELAQSLGFSREDVYRTVTWVYSREIGEPYQEVGGVMITLAALCNAAGLDMHENGEIELRRINTPEMIEKIRAKQATKQIKAYET